MGNCFAIEDNSSSVRPSSASPVHNDEDENPIQNFPAVGETSTAAPELKIFTFAALRSATRNFRPDTLLGEGGFGRVFKGWIDEKTCAPSRVGVGIPVAVKKSNPDSEQGLKEWRAEVKLGKFRHPHLVKLLGYCWEENQFLLVYEYMQKGSLASHLFRNGVDTIPWNTRLKIAIGAARGAAFLHTTEKQVIYRDFKAANILLDSEFNAKLSDFGLAKLGPTDGNSHVTTKIMGTYGYAAPEYLATGHLYVKSDVFGFGVVLLEIITGLQALDLNRPGGQANLVDWAKPMLPSRKKLKKLMDPRMKGEYPSKAAIRTSELIIKCLEPDPKHRPTMEVVVDTLEEIILILMKPKESNTKARHDRGDGHHQQWTPRHTYHGGDRTRDSASSEQRERTRPNVIRSY